MSFLKRDSDFGSSEHISVISAECNFTGVLNIQGSLRVDGKLEGSVDNARHIVVGEGGSVIGDLSAKTIVISGAVQGNICAENLELLATAKTTGDIRAHKIIVEEGASLDGKVTVSMAENGAKEEAKESSKEAAPAKETKTTK